MLNNQEIPTPLLIEDLGMQFTSDSKTHKLRYGIFKCPHCNKHFKAGYYNVQSGKTNSCGCVRYKWSHGKSSDRIYSIYIHIKGRIFNPNNDAYNDYGNRGITICEEWNNDFKSFYNWAINNGYDKNLSIDRIDVNGNYEPSNCRWANKQVQNINTRLLRNSNTSGYRGVVFRKDRNKFVARIGLNNKTVNLGSFCTDKEAAIAYNNYIIENKLEHPLNPV